MRRLAEFDTVIDARSPAEYAEDHLPGAVNWPVLDDDERRAVGTDYKQVSAFDARKRGAVLVARRVAEQRHYDPIYLRSMRQNFAGLRDARTLALTDGDAAALDRAAAALLHDA